MGAILLPDCTLFPHGALPLHIFEPRYRQMLEDALKGDCLFCVARLTASEEQEDLAACTAPIGTAGLIRASRERPDGRSDLILHGVVRVRFLEWLAENSYPYVRIEPMGSDNLDEKRARQESKRLRDAVENVLLGLPDNVVEQVESLLERASDPTIMCDAIAQQFVHEADLRQTLLEEPSICNRIDLLIEHLASLRIGEN